MKPYLGDQLRRDESDDYQIEWAPKDEEPRLNVWMRVECDTPWGKEEVIYLYCDGAYIRDHVFVDYVEGGHFYRYGWVAEPHIIIEDILSIMDQVCTGVHEIHERYRMKYLGWTYEKAHASACVIERKLRRLALERFSVLPEVEDIKKIFALEGSGEDCESFAREAMGKYRKEIEKANEQANSLTGKKE